MPISSINQGCQAVLCVTICFFQINAISDDQITLLYFSYFGCLLSVQQICSPSFYAGRGSSFSAIVQGEPKIQHQMIWFACQTYIPLTSPNSYSPILPHLKAVRLVENLMVLGTYLLNCSWTLQEILPAFSQLVLWEHQEDPAPHLHGQHLHLLVQNHWSW